jgi:rubrerythrin
MLLFKSSHSIKEAKMTKKSFGGTSAPKKEELVVCSACGKKIHADQIGNCPYCAVIAQMGGE